ncbi:DUF1674 domain-containing protein [Candidatus Liberibacter africanus]|uniref:DUF1674 domain-containing protein n=1 Tax=Liberibacter africanus TaxID=34020 RepID=UPI0031401B73
MNSTKTTPTKPLSSIAKRALEEAKQRRSTTNQNAKLPIEIGGGNRLDPTRFGDWEKTEYL